MNGSVIDRLDLRALQFAHRVGRWLAPDPAGTAAALKTPMTVLLLVADS